MNGNNILLSIIIPVYNIEPYLRRCVESISGQGIEDMEIILVDDGSTDGSAELCDELSNEDRRIRVIHKLNGGVNTARNAGLDAAKGIRIAFVDGDDYIEPTTLTRALKFLEEHPEVDLLQYPEKHIKEGETDWKLWNNYPFNDKIIIDIKEKIDALIGSHPVLPGGLWGKIYSSRLWGNLRLREDMQFCEDTYILPEILEKSKGLAIISSGGYMYVIREGSASNSKYTPKKSLDVARLKNKLYEYALKYQIQPEKWWLEATESSISSRAFYGICEELTCLMKYLQKTKLKAKPVTPKRPILKIAILFSPMMAASLYNVLLKLKR